MWNINNRRDDTFMIYEDKQFFYLVKATMLHFGVKFDGADNLNIIFIMR